MFSTLSGTVSRAITLAAKSSRTYTVKDGDTLSGVFGDAWKKVSAANPKLVPGSIRIGTVINIPEGVASPAGQPAKHDASAPAKTPAKALAAKADNTGGSSIGRKALNYASSKVDSAQYVSGGTGPSVFDCSGLVWRAFKESGLNWKRKNAISMSTLDYPAVSKGSLQAGDVVFFYFPVSHVGIADGKGNVVHASNEDNDLMVSKVSSMPFHNAYRITV